MDDGRSSISAYYIACLDQGRDINYDVIVPISTKSEAKSEARIVQNMPQELTK